jgi:hypothetical protein
LELGDEKGGEAGCSKDAHFYSQNEKRCGCCCDKRNCHHENNDRMMRKSSKARSLDAFQAKMKKSARFKTIRCGNMETDNIPQEKGKNPHVHNNRNLLKLLPL